MATIKCCPRSHSTGRAKCCDNCNCDERKEAARIYQQEYRRKQKAHKAGLGKLSAVPDIPKSQSAKTATVETQYPVGIIGKNALAEIAKIDGATERNPLIVALIMRLAHELDSGETESVSASANAMKRMLDDLRKQAPPPEPVTSPVAALSPQQQFFGAFMASEGKAAGQ